MVQLQTSLRSSFVDGVDEVGVAGDETVVVKGQLERMALASRVVDSG